jgi:regulatory protein
VCLNLIFDCEKHRSGGDKILYFWVSDNGLMQQQLTPKKALPKAKQYCAYQERCHSEVKEKLYGFGLNGPEVDQIISTLIEENYLNEERFAISYAGGHFRIKQWGRVKIKYQLKKKMVSEYCIKKALASINDDEYMKTFARLAEQKLKLLKSEKNQFIRAKKLQDYLLQKGFESELIKEVVLKKRY